MIKIAYTIKRARASKPIDYPNLDAMLTALRQILEGREKTGFLGKVWLTIDIHQEEYDETREYDSTNQQGD